MRAFLEGFKYAARGVVYCIKNERNMRFHCVVALYLFLFLPFFELTRTQYAVLFITVAGVMSLEIINTAVETVINRLCASYDQMARIAKDAAAGAVLVGAAASVAVGTFLLWQPSAFAEIYSFFSGNLPAFAVLILSLVFFAVFVFQGPRGIKNKIIRCIKTKKK